MKVLKFYASWCAPCKQLSQVIEDNSDAITATIESIDIEQNQELAIRYGIRSVPVMVVVDEAGTEIRRQGGMMMPDKLLEFLGEA
jgi:thioredoxin 1